LVQAGLVADTLDLEALLVALADAPNHVGDQAAGQAVQGSALAVVVGPGDLDGLAAVFQLHLHERVRAQLELALGTLDPDLAVGDLDLDAAGDDHRLLADAGHDATSLTHFRSHVDFGSV